MLLPGIGTTNPIRPNQSHMVLLVGCGMWGVCALSLGSCTLMSDWYLYLSVRLVLMPDAGRICAGAKRSGYIRWVNFQQLLQVVGVVRHCGQ